MKYTFRGGAHVKEHKHTAACPIEPLRDVGQVAIPMSQHIGIHCTPTVAVGDYVYRGQMIGDVANGLGCPVHSSVSGKVLAIEKRQNVMGTVIEHVIIENDGQGTLAPEIVPRTKGLSETSNEELIEIIRRAGISGMGGATFPTYAKIQSALGKVDRVIINCAECEPYITVNHRLMLEEPMSILGGTQILLKIFGVMKARIAVEDNKMDAVRVLRRARDASRRIRIKIMKTKYPQGDERQLIYALTKKEIPAGKLPADVGCVIFNAETCAAIYHAFVDNMPLIDRLVTVDGDCIRTPKNLRVPIGTSYTDLIAACGGLKKVPDRVINGGPMMGFAQWSLDTPVTKGTAAVLVLSKDKVQKQTLPSACIRCGTCVKNCPMHLMPNYLAAFARTKQYAEAEKLNVLSCVECGTCSYRCPGQVEIVQYIRVAKGAIRAEQAAARARASAAAPDLGNGGKK
ncbi:MAG: electron transport complex subunit RsxC [Clostridia bacterium]|nr:electron transport complex subunit RsxC [Clostridia bacterium]